MSALPVRHVPHATVEARDGTRLSAALFLPDAPGDGPWPAILDAVPYRKDDDFRATDWGTYAAIATLGVACVRLDLRGTGSSEGVLPDEYSEVEHEDCEDAIAWIAAQPWCNGRVGMTGVSWGGFNAVQVAMRRPPALGAIAPIHWSADRYGCDVHMVGGTLHALESVDWQGGMVVENALPPRPAHVGAAEVERIWRERLEGTPQWPLGWLGRQRRDAYWRRGSLCEDWSAVAVPVLAIGGWLDGYRDACLDLLAHGTAPRRAVIGPWAHARPHAGWPGPALDHRALLARFFRHHLAGDANGEEREPMLLAYVQDGIPGEPYPEGDVPGRWRAFRSWPPAPGAAAALHLDGAALVPAPPLAPPAPRAWCGPWSVGVRGPRWCPGGPPTGYGADMRPDDDRSLTWTTSPLPRALEVLGGPVAELEVRVDRPVAQVAVRLEHVHPDGTSALATRAVLNLTRADGGEEPRPVPVGVPLRVRVRLPAIGLAIPAGHRLRVAVAGCDWPLAWPPPQPVRVEVLGGVLSLPAPAAGDEVPAPPPPAAAVPPPLALVHDDVPAAWELGHEAVSGETRTRLASGWSTTLPDGGRSAGTSAVVASILDHDPASCRVESWNTATVVHDGLAAHARSRLALHGDAERLHVEVELAVERDGSVVFERSWRASAPRDLL